MNRQTAAIHIIGLFTQQIEKLGVGHRDQKVKGVIGIAHNEEQSRFPVAQGVQLQLIISGQLPQLLNVKGGQTRTAANQNRLGCFS